MRVGTAIATSDTMKVGGNPAFFPTDLLEKQIERLRNAQRH